MEIVVMGSAEWLAAQHPMLVHLSIACVMLLPIALIAAQRKGRGIKPWWVTCRYLAWMGVLGSLVAFISGWQTAKLQGVLPKFRELFSALPAPNDHMRWHQFLAILACVVGLACLKSMYRRREEHEGIGVQALMLGLMWLGLTLPAANHAHQMNRPSAGSVAPRPAKAEAPTSVAEPEAKVPLRALDYGSLVPMHTEPVKSPAHGNRWIRVWASPEAAEAYQNGQAIPAGALVVMSTVEDRWGRPGYESGPLYALDLKTGKPELLLYWPRVPEAKRNETNGAERVYWRGVDPNLSACLQCHASGIAPAKDRSKWVVPKKPKAEETLTPFSPVPVEP
jgi:uncharacterized membrane protein